MKSRNAQRAIATLAGLLVLLGALLLRPDVQALDSGFGPDFNSDGYADLAVGVPAEDVMTPQANMVDAGAVQVLYGSSTGITANGAQFWHQDQPGILDAVEADDGFGGALLGEDFNGDGFFDLAVGVSDENVAIAQSDVDDAGAVAVLYGSAAGLSATNDQFWHQDQPNVEDAVEENDEFGETLAAEDFNRDGIADLAVGVPGESIVTSQGNLLEAGAVAVLYGSAAGLSAANDQFWHQDRPGVGGAVEADDDFGDTLATGDFNSDNYDDLAIGVPHEDFGVGWGDAGVVVVLYGSPNGLTAANSQFWHQDQSGIQGGVEPGDAFGDALAVSDFNRDGYHDLAVGVPGENLDDGKNDVGVVAVIFGSANGLTADGNQLWHLDQPGILDAAVPGDHFGTALATGHYNSDSYADLAVGVPGKDLPQVVDCGIIVMLYGSSNGLSEANNRTWYQGLSGTNDARETEDAFGTSLN